MRLATSSCNPACQEMCFAPQRRALSQRRNSQKCSEHLTSKCASHHSTVHFWTSQLAKVLRAWGAFSILTSEICFAPRRHVISDLHLTRSLCTRSVSEPTSRPFGATNHWKNTAFCEFSIFSRACIFFLWLFLFSLFFFLLSLLWLFPPLLFSFVHIVGSLTSKLPAMIVVVVVVVWCSGNCSCGCSSSRCICSWSCSDCSGCSCACRVVWW